MALTRRSVLAAVAGGALAACAPAGARPGAPAPSAAPGAPGAPDVPGAPASVSASPVSTASASPVSVSPAPVAAGQAGQAAAAGPPAADGVAVPGRSPAPGRAPVLGRAGAEARYGTQTPGLWGLDVPGVLTRLPGAAGGPGRAGTGDLALTFDACGGPGGSGYDAALIDFLRAHGVPATLFLNARWIDANRSVCEQLAADPLFEIANHGTLHRPLSVSGRSAYGLAGTANAGEAYEEIAGNAEKLTALLGRPPAFFRSGTAHYDEVAVRIVAELGEQVAGFTVNGDGGATYTAAQVRAEVAAAPPGAIVIGHVNHPGGGTARGIAAAVPELLAAGRRFVRLSDALG